MQTTLTIHVPLTVEHPDDVPVAQVEELLQHRAGDDLLYVHKDCEEARDLGIVVQRVEYI